MLQRQTQAVRPVAIAIGEWRRTDGADRRFRVVPNVDVSWTTFIA